MELGSFIYNKCMDKEKKESPEPMTPLDDCRFFTVYARMSLGSKGLAVVGPKRRYRSLRNAARLLAGIVEDLEPPTVWSELFITDNTGKEVLRVVYDDR